MPELSELLRSETVSDRIKCPKSESEQVVAKLNEIDGVEARQVSTDEFDIPPTAIIRTKVKITEI